MTTASTSPISPVPPAHRGGLTAAQREMFRTMLEEQRRFRVAQLAADPPASLPVPRHETAADREVGTAILEAARVALRDIDAALTRMAAGSYGKCTECGAAQRLERLEILPQVALCMDCQRASQ